MRKFEILCSLLPAEVNWGDPITPQMIDEIVLAEREACAKVLRDKHDQLAKRSYPPPKILLEMESAILARSNVEGKPTAEGRSA